MKNIFFLLILMLLIGALSCSKSSNHQSVNLDIKNQNDLNKLLLRIVDDAEKNVVSKYPALVKKAKAIPSSDSGLLIIPKAIWLADDGLGIESHFVFFDGVSKNAEEARSGLELVLGYSDSNTYYKHCREPKLNWMANFGYHVRETFYAENGEVIISYYVDTASCQKYLECMNNNGGSIMPVGMCDMTENVNP